MNKRKPRSLRGKLHDPVKNSEDWLACESANFGFFAKETTQRIQKKCPDYTLGRTTSLRQSTHSSSRGFGRIQNKQAQWLRSLLETMSRDADPSKVIERMKLSATYRARSAREMETSIEAANEIKREKAKKWKTKNTFTK
jgi:hypothetical protein